MINTWNESSLHETLKHTWCGVDGAVEVARDGVICDAVRSDGTIIEVQTTSFGKIKDKLSLLLPDNRIELVYPVAVNLFIETLAADGTVISCRKSPKHGTIYQVFGEMTGITHLLGHSNLSITVVFTDVREMRINDGSGSWRRKGIRIAERTLECIHDTRTFCNISDFASLLPASLPEHFTVSDLRKAGAGRYAGKMAWVLRKTNCILLAGKNKNAFVYTRA